MRRGYGNEWRPHEGSTYENICELVSRGPKAIRRHADVRTTLTVYAHIIPQSQRDAMEAVSIGTVPVMEQEPIANG